jgi:hypothetical protein
VEEEDGECVLGLVGIGLDVGIKVPTQLPVFEGSRRR